MAKGAGRPCVKCYLAFALIVLIALAATNVWNPFPGVWDWVNRSEPLSEPDVIWQQRLGGSPKSVTIAGGVVIVEQRTRVEARSLETGLLIWERKADWAAVAGDHQAPVVVVGKLLVKGYDVLDPATGAVRRHDSAASAVWTWRNALLDARCRKSTDCTLTAWDPRGSTPLWSAYLPGINTSLFADNPDTLGTRRLTADRVEPGAGGPELAPSLLGLKADERVYVVDTAAGRVVHDVEPGETERLVVVGGRLLRIEAQSRDGTCYFTVTARDPATGQQVWRRAGVNLRTADGAGCVQRKDPQGGRNVVVGVAADTREAVIDAYDGRPLWVGPEGERLLAVDDRFAVARSRDGRGIGGYQLGREAPRWSRAVSPDAGVALTRYAVIVIERKPDRIIALDQMTGEELISLHSSAEVLAVGPGGLILGDGRDIGYVRWANGAAGQPARGGPGAGPAPDGNAPGGAPGGGAPGGDRPGGAGPTCGGPKDEQCPGPADGGKDG